MKYINNIFTGFSLNIPGQITPAPENNVHIKITSDYQWGSGWTAMQAKRFEDIVYPKLEEAGYVLHFPKDSFGCPTLTNPDNKMDLYLHPMEFTGYATKEDTEKIIAILRDCSEAVYETSLLYANKVYDISDEEYKQILEDNKDRIINHIQSIPDYKKYLYDAGFDFAKASRIPRIGDGPGYSYNNTDITYVSKLAKELKQQLQLETEFER